MKKIIKSRIFTFIFGAIIFGSIGVYAATNYAANQITYNKNGQATVDKALDDLYSKQNKFKNLVCMFIDNTYGERGNIGAKYSCNPGDGEARNFYILNINDTTVDLIMDRNIIQGTIQWNAAMNYFESGDGKTYKNSWKNVKKIELPSVEDISHAVGNDDWTVNSSTLDWCLETKKVDSSSDPYCYNETTKTLWLWDYNRDCSTQHCKHSLDSSWAYGYWTKNLTSDSSVAWYIYSGGSLFRASIDDNYRGIRPVITILKSQLN